jgi:hypothetical protein
VTALVGAILGPDIAWWREVEDQLHHAMRVKEFRKRLAEEERHRRPLSETAGGTAAGPTALPGVILQDLSDIA